MVMAPSAILTDHEFNTFNKHKLDCVLNSHDVDETSQPGLASRSLVQRVLKEQIASIDTDECEPGEEDAFYVADLGEVYRQHVRWKMNLSRVKPFYGK